MDWKTTPTSCSLLPIELRLSHRMIGPFLRPILAAFLRFVEQFPKEVNWNYYEKYNGLNATDTIEVQNCVHVVRQFLG